MMNVKTPYTGLIKGNPSMKQLTADTSDDKLIFLNKFIDWLEQ